MLGSRLNDIVQLLAEIGIREVVVSPGSRNAPLVAAFIKNGHFQLHSSPDERSAAFAAMGMSLKNQYPALFICTSGSALVNAYPAVLEAYYQRIPLWILSADRPEHLIDQWDGQTIRQNGIFVPNVRAQIHINARETSFPHIQESLYACAQKGLVPIPGPVHVNIALSDPIYEGIGSQQHAEQILPFVYKAPIIPKVSPEMLKPYHRFQKIAILIGHQAPSTLLSLVLEEIQHHLPVFSDIGSSQVQRGLHSWDWGLLKRDIPEDLAPDLLISIGTTILSKPLKEFLRKSKPKHIHLGLEPEVGDPFFTHPIHIPCVPADFLQGLLEQELPKDYVYQWQTFLSETPLTVHDLPEPFRSELDWMQHFFAARTEQDQVHVGNSMPVRYASWSMPTQAAVYCNRGVSGIDGCLSTAIGFAKADPKQQVYCIVGDITAIYDSNALWMELPKNFTLVIFNNKGGRIFDWIEGPQQMDALQPYIHTPHHFEFSALMAFYQIPHRIFSQNQLHDSLAIIHEPRETPLVIELQTGV
jgi:2-succinyl-5-enolpyruvyl-6-hydroxy-3-cyclohexene-1-carboxylate synthase